MAKRKKNRARVKPSPEVKAIYDKVPEMEDCKGMCQKSCGPIPAYAPERKLVEEYSGKKLTTNGNLTCSMLTAAGACSVYGVRPLICRLWGTVDIPTMRCQLGCRPTRWLTEEESRELLREMEEATGDTTAGSEAFEQMLAGLSESERRRFKASVVKVASRDA